MDTLPTVYHGTSAERWADTKPGDLYVTIDPESAERYAQEWAEEDETPLVLRIDGDALAALGLECQPNWETVEQYEGGSWGDPLGKPASNLTWQDTLKLNGTFCIARFTHAHKSAVDVHPTSAPAPGM
jgi:hypothetical protein